jgi:hypothetical protein
VVLVLQVQLMEHRLQEQEVVEVEEVLEMDQLVEQEVAVLVLQLLALQQEMQKQGQPTLVVAVVEQVIIIQLQALVAEQADLV